MNFERFKLEPINEFDNLGYRKDAESPNERRSEINKSLEAVRARIAQLEQDIKIMSEEDYVSPGTHIEEKNMELQEAISEKEVLEQELKASETGSKIDLSSSTN